MCRLRSQGAWGRRAFLLLLLSLQVYMTALQIIDRRRRPPTVGLASSTTTWASARPRSSSHGRWSIGIDFSGVQPGA
ncbi:hypothetical protein C8Q78DRAFT_410865 [Trametes maxima]|nr:hypothetical protein C8Q78DRAFT_410865 [Trametes maxima]